MDNKQWGEQHPYNGYECYNAWNISLWINNDYPMYEYALDCIKDSVNRNTRPVPNAFKYFDVKQSIINLACTFFLLKFKRTGDGIPFDSTAEDGHMYLYSTLLELAEGNDLLKPYIANWFNLN